MGPRNYLSDMDLGETVGSHLAGSNSSTVTQNACFAKGRAPHLSDRLFDLYVETFLTIR
jgi:hypothetical protein